MLQFSHDIKTAAASNYLATAVFIIMHLFSCVLQ